MPAQTRGRVFLGFRLWMSLGAGLVLLLAAPAGAQEADWDRFAAFDNDSAATLDHSLWTAFLQKAVFEVGLSDRVPAKRPLQETGTRRISGSSSDFRFENNRIVYHLLDDEVAGLVTAYREALEGLPGQLDLATLNRNEQLAYWLNLYSAVVIEQLLAQYPVKDLRNAQLADGSGPFYEAAVVTVDGVPLSLNDIKHNIVFRHWRDPLAIYGFFDGTIGGVRIPTEAYTGPNIARLLTENAEEFVNALRGVRRFNDRLIISQVYGDAAILFPAWPDDLLSHLNEHASSEVADAIAGAARVEATSYDWTIADMLGGAVSSTSYTVTRGLYNDPNMRKANTVGSAYMEELMQSTKLKFEKFELEAQYWAQKNRRRGEVTVEDVPTEDEPEDER